MQQLEKEEQRRRNWKYVVIGSTLVICVVLVLFIINSAKQNPLEGEWINQEDGYRMSIDDDELQIETSEWKIEFSYALDKGEKTILIQEQPEDYEEASKDADEVISAQEIDETLSDFVKSFYYSIDGDTLTLTEREYGEQFIYKKSK